MTFLAYFIGVAVGIGSTLCIAMKSWKEGYDAAKNTYSDWSKGFDTGYDAGYTQCRLEMEDDLK